MSNHQQTATARTSKKDDPDINRYFPEHHIFIRPLTVKDRKMLAILYKTSEGENDGISPKFGVFDSGNTLIGAYGDSIEPFQDAVERGYVILWMH